MKVRQLNKERVCAAPPVVGGVVAAAAARVAVFALLLWRREQPRRFQGPQCVSMETTAHGRA